MRYVLAVIGSQEQKNKAVPRIVLGDSETLHDSVWYACRNQDTPSGLLDDTGSFVLRMLRAPLLAYDLYHHVHAIKLWSGKRPLVIVRGRSLASRVAAYASRWGGGDVVMPVGPEVKVLGPTRYLLLEDGRLELRSD